MDPVDLACRWLGHDHVMHQSVPDWKDDWLWYAGDCERCGAKFKYRRRRTELYFPELRVYQAVKHRGNPVVIEEHVRPRY